MKTYHRLISLLVALIALAICSGVQAANIVWVSDTPNVNGFSPAEAGTPDDTFVLLLQTAGHSVIRYTSDDNTANLMSQADIDALNTNDLIIIGRAVGSGAFTGAQAGQWNTSITKPIIVQSGYITRASRLGWFQGGDTVFDGPPMPLVAVTPTDPENAYLFNLFGTAGMNGSAMVGNYDEAFERNTSQTVETPVAGGNILATGNGTNKVIVEFPAGTTVKTSQVLAGYRLYFASGNREASALATAGRETLTPAGEAIFLRAVSLALGNGVAPNLGNAPVITLDPVGTNLCTGETLILTAVATGENPLYYQWMLDGNPVPSGTNATLSLTFQTTDAGSYTVVVSNAVGGLSTATSAAATVVSDGEGIIINPLVASQTACPGDAVTFTASATGAGTLTYTWRKGDTIVQGPDTDNTLDFASVTPGDAGSYSVTVVGDCNSASNAFSLTVTAPPAITVQPVSQTAPMGNIATFTVTATGAGTLAYQWQLNEADIDGATSASYTTPTLTVADSGSYRVIVSNCGGPTTSAAAVLTVTPIAGISFDFNPPGQFTNAPYSMNFNDWLNSGFSTPVLLFESPVGGVGPYPGSGSLDLAPNTGTGAAINNAILLPLSYDFSLPGKTLFASTMMKVKTPFRNAAERSTQMGFCTSTNADLDNSVGRSYMTVIMQQTVSVSPTFDLRQSSKPNGASTHFEGNATTASLLTVSNWYKLDIAFVNTKDLVAGTYTVRGTLTDMGPNGTTPSASPALSFGPVSITNVDVTAARQLWFVLRGNENSGVEARDNTYVYTKTGDVEFVAPPASQTVLQGRRAIFKALVDGEGPYTYQWYKNYEAIPGATSWKYITPPVTTADDGAEYQVEVSNPTISGVYSEIATLTVQADALTVVGAGSVDGTTVGVEFNQPVDPATAENPANYDIDGTAPVAARIYRTGLGATGADGIYVVLTPASILSADFTLTVSGVQDLSGNSIGANSTSGHFAGLTGVDVNPLATAPAGEQYCFGQGKFIVMGGGADIWNNADLYHYVYSKITGDFDVKVKVPYLDVVRSATKAGFHVRNSLDPFDQVVGTFVNPMWPSRNYPEGSRRDLPNIASASWGNTPTYNLAWYPNTWLRFRRAGNTFMRYSSTNGVNWQFDGQVSLILPETIYRGLAVCSVANNNMCNAQFEQYGDFAGYAGATIAISSQPTNFTVSAGSSFTDGLIASVSGGGIPASAGELAYAWQRNDGSGNWTNLFTGGATNHTVAIGPLYITDNGAQFRCILKAPGAADVISDTFTATVTDAAVPTVAASTISPGWSANSIVITFSEPVSAATATNVANYTVTNSAGVDMGVAGVAFLGNDPRTVVITTVSTLVGDRYVVVINNVQDLNGLALAANTLRSIVQPAAAPGAPVVVEYYYALNNSPADITALTANIKYTQNTPDLVVYSNVFGINPLNANLPDTFNNYGVKMYTYFVPPSSGAYKFYIRADDYAQFLMNTNATDSVNPAGAVVQYSLTGAQSAYAAARSVTNTLVGGRAYYMELRFKETSGGDGGTVAVRTDNTVPGQGEVIPGTQCAFPAAVVKPTPVVVELYTGYQGRQTGNGNIDQLIANTNFPGNSYIVDTINYNYIANTPVVFGYSRYLGFNTNLAQPQGTFDNYVGRMMSYFVAPTNGLYKFYIRSDDSSQLWMNTNAVNSTDPAGKMLLGQLSAYTGNYTLVAQNVNLVGGQKYYIEGLWREGTGGDGMTVAVRSQGDGTAPTVQDVIPGDQLELPTPLARIGEVSLVGVVPANPTVPDGQSITLAAAGIGGAPPYGTMWFKDGVLVLANTITNITQPLTLADDGAVYTLVVTNFFSRVERSVTVTVLADNTAPTVVRTVGRRYNDGFSLVFSEPVDAMSATFLGNYQISGGLRILSAALDMTGTIVSFETTPQTMSTTYSVTINDVKDASSAGNVIATDTTAMFSTWTVGGSGIMVELFTNIVGSTIAELTGQPKFQANLPDVVYYTNVFGVGVLSQNTGLESYGARVTSYFVAPNTALYRFYIRSDDSSQLWMNVNNADSENPAGRTMLIHMPSANQNINSALAISPPVSLIQGQRYYMEALLKEGTGGDYVQVAYRECDANGISLTGMLTDNNVSENMSSALFGGAPGNPDAIVICGTPPTELAVIEGEQVNLTLCVSASPNILAASSRQWQKFDGAAFTNIPGANGLTLSFPAKLDDNGAQYRLRASFPGLVQDYVTTLAVTADDTGPFIVSANSLDGRSFAVQFNEPVELNPSGSAVDPVNYAINGLPIETSPYFGTLLSDQKTVVFSLIESSYIWSETFTVDAYDIYNQAATPVSGASSAVGYNEFLTAQDIGTAGDPLLLGSTFTVTNKSFTMKAGGSDVWGTADHMQMAYRTVTGNFDIKVRVESDRGPGAWSKAGLMIRGSAINASARTMFLAVTPNTLNVPVGANRYAFQWRDIDAASAAWASEALISPPYPNAWMRMQRIGSVINVFWGTNGVDWTFYSSRDTAAYGLQGGPYPDTMVVGMFLDAGNNTDPVGAQAEFRELDFPLPPTIIAQPTPADTTVSIHQSVSFTGLAAVGMGPFTYQWVKDGLPIPGETTDTLTIADTAVAHSGVYTVRVGNNGGVTVAGPCVLTVVNDPPDVVGETLNVVQGNVLTVPVDDLVANDVDPEGDPLSIYAVSGMPPASFATDFNAGIPVGATAYSVAGGGYWSATDGVAGSGCVKITDAVGSQAGAIVLDELNPGKRVAGFIASFKIRIVAGTVEPADGFSFNFANDLPLAAGTGYGESGAGSGVSFCIDNYRFAPYPAGGTANTAGMKVRYNGAEVTGVQIPIWNADRYVPITVTLVPGGFLVVTVDGTNVFGTVALPGYVNKPGRAGFYGRTGGSTMAQWVDDVSLSQITVDTAHGYTNLGGTQYGTTYVSGSGGVGNTGNLHLTDAANNQAGSFILNELTPGAAVQSFSASFALRIGDGTANGADGFSFNLAADLPNAATGATAAEEGLGTGLSLCVDNYPTGGADSPSFKIKWAGAQLGFILIPKWNSPNWVPITINMDADGTLDVIVDGTNVVANLPTPYTPVMGRFGLFARTGGQNETHWVDDLSISVNGEPVYAQDFNAGGPGTVTMDAGVVTYTPPANSCGTDTFYYIVSDGQLNGLTVAQATVNITEATPLPPVIENCAADRTIGVDATCAAVVPDFTAAVLATDNCCCLTVTQDPVAGTPVALGSSTVITITVTDTMGLTAQCTATLTVVDLTAPELTCPAPLMLAVGVALPDLTVGALATEACSLPVVLTQDPPAGTMLPLGDNNVTITAEDAAGNSSSCVVVVTVVVPPAVANWVYNPTAGTFEFTFATELGKSYLVQYKDDLNAATWTTLTTIPGTGGPVSFTDPTNPLPPSRFYQVLVQ